MARVSSGPKVDKVEDALSGSRPGPRKIGKLKDENGAQQCQDGIPNTLRRLKVSKVLKCFAGSRIFRGAIGFLTYLSIILANIGSLHSFYLQEHQHFKPEDGTACVQCPHARWDSRLELLIFASQEFREEGGQQRQERVLPNHQGYTTVWSTVLQTFQDLQISVNKSGCRTRGANSLSLSSCKQISSIFILTSSALRAFLYKFFTASRPQNPHTPQHRTRCRAPTSSTFKTRHRDEGPESWSSRDGLLLLTKPVSRYFSPSVLHCLFVTARLYYWSVQYLSLVSRIRFEFHQLAQDLSS